jgi:hypothetical protein
MSTVHSRTGKMCYIEVIIIGLCKIENVAAYENLVCTYVRMYVCTYVRTHARMHACMHGWMDASRFSLEKGCKNVPKNWHAYFLKPGRDFRKVKTRKKCSGFESR